MIINNFINLLNINKVKKINFFIIKYYQKIFFILTILKKEIIIKNFSIISIYNKYYLFIELFKNKNFIIKKINKNIKNNYTIENLKKLKNKTNCFIFTTNKGLKTLSECIFLNLGGFLSFIIEN